MVLLHIGYLPQHFIVLVQFICFNLLLLLPAYFRLLANSFIRLKGSIGFKLFNFVLRVVFGPAFIGYLLMRDFYVMMTRSYAIPEQKRRAQRFRGLDYRRILQDLINTIRDSLNERKTISYEALKNKNIVKTISSLSFKGALSPIGRPSYTGAKTKEDDDVLASFMENTSNFSGSSVR